MVYRYPSSSSTPWKIQVMNGIYIYMIITCVGSKGGKDLIGLISVDPIQASTFSSQKSDVPKDAARGDASVDGSTGTFTRFTHAAEVLATQAATQAPPFLW